MMFRRMAALVCAGIVAMTAGTLGASAAAADASTDFATDAALCKEIGYLPYTPGDQSYAKWGVLNVPGLGTKTNFACGPRLRLDKPTVPTDGRPVTVNTALGMVSIPCALNPAANPFKGEKQFGYIGLPNDAFGEGGSGDWQFMKDLWGAEQRAEYVGGGVFTATRVGTFSLVGEFPDTLNGGVVKCNATVIVAPKATQPADSAKCTAAKKMLAKAKAHGTKKQIAVARKRVVTACAARVA